MEGGRVKASNSVIFGIRMIVFQLELQVQRGECQANVIDLILIAWNVSNYQSCRVQHNQHHRNSQCEHLVFVFSFPSTN